MTNDKRMEMFTGSEDDYIDALAKAKLAKLTPRLKSQLTRIGSNEYVINKIAEHVVWRVVSQTDSEGKQAFYLARVNDTSKAKKKTAAEDPLPEPSDNAPAEMPSSGTMTEILVDTISMQQDAITVTPTNCPGKGKVQDLQNGEDGKPCCMLHGKKCSHLHDFSITVLNGDKTINCDVKA